MYLLLNDKKVCLKLATFFESYNNVDATYGIINYYQ